MGDRPESIQRFVDGVTRHQYNRFLAHKANKRILNLLNNEHPNLCGEIPMHCKAHTVHVRFPYDLTGRGTRYTNKIYQYLTDDDNIRKGDYVVVMSPTTGPTTVEVMDVYFNTRDFQAFKWVIDKVDFTAYQNRTAKAEYEAARKRGLEQRVQEITQKLKDREKALKDELLREKFQRDEIYQTLVGQLQSAAQQLRYGQDESDSPVHFAA